MGKITAKNVLGTPLQTCGLDPITGFAPPVILEASHEKCLEIVSLADLKYHELRWKQIWVFCELFSQIFFLHQARREDALQTVRLGEN